jgi:hypothetical protein
MSQWSFRTGSVIDLEGITRHMVAVALSRLVTQRDFDSWASGGVPAL